MNFSLGKYYRESSRFPWLTQNIENTVDISNIIYPSFSTLA